MEKILTKRVWIGIAVSLAVLIVGLVIGTSLIYKNLLAYESGEVFLTILCSAAVFSGALIAAKGKSRRLLRAMIVCGFDYLLLWALTLSGEGDAVFDGYTLWVTAVMWGSGILGSLLASRTGKRNRGKKKGKLGAGKRKRAVT